MATDADKLMLRQQVAFHGMIQKGVKGIQTETARALAVFRIPRDDLCKTVCAWDLGMGDSTVIWVAQVVGSEIRLMDFYENNGVGLDSYVNWLRHNGWDKAEQILPHDVQVRELGTGKSRLEVLTDAGLNIRVAEDALN